MREGSLFKPNGHSRHYGEFVNAGATQRLRHDAPLKSPSEWRLIGTPQPQWNNSARVNGAAAYGIDLALPDLRRAAVRMCPILGGRLVRVDFSRARQAPGVFHAFEVEASHGCSTAVAVVARTWWQARRALALVDVQWGAGPSASIDSDAAIDQMRQAVQSGEGHPFRVVGDPDAALANAPTRLEAEYSVPYLAHAALEPINCTVRICDNEADVWCGTQVPGLARDAVQRIVRPVAGTVRMHVQALGGAFGRRLEVDHVAQATLIALRGGDGQPVQTLWTREEDTSHDFYRPAAVARMRAGLSASGQVSAWIQETAGQSIIAGYARRVLNLPAFGPDKTTSEGAFDQPYEFTAARMSHRVVDVPVPVGFWRSVGHSYQAFFKECFLDEVAHASGQDPLALREALLSAHPKHLAVLRAAARLADWGTPLAPTGTTDRRGRGLALHPSFGSIVAPVAEVVVSDRGLMRCQGVAGVIDCGPCLTPSGVAP